MRILVLGHLGYVGTRIAPILAAAGHELAGIDSHLYRNCTFGDPTEAVRIERAATDIRAVPRSAFEGVDAVLHLAGLPHDPEALLGPTLPYLLQKASVELAEAARTAGVGRFVVCSGTGVYGPVWDREIVEDHPLSPSAPCDRAAALVEWDLARLADDTFSPTFLRLPTVYGSSARLRLDSLPNDLVARAYTVGTVVVEGDGRSWSPLVHVEDVCEAVLAVLTAPRPLIHGEAFNVGGTRENYRVRDIADLAVGAVPGAVIRSTRASSPVPPGFRVNCDKIADVLDFRPAWDLRRGASELVSTFRRGRLTLEDYTSARYRRLQHLSDLLAAGRIGSDLRSRPPVQSTLPFS